MLGLWKKAPLAGVGSMSTLEGGLPLELTELNEPEADIVGVAGMYWHSVLMGINGGISCCTKMVGL